MMKLIFCFAFCWGGRGGGGGEKGFKRMTPVSFYLFTCSRLFFLRFFFFFFNLCCYFIGFVELLLERSRG